MNKELRDANPISVGALLRELCHRAHAGAQPDECAWHNITPVQHGLASEAALQKWLRQKFRGESDVGL
ncbi:MAG: hypothetical protein WAM44_18480, partial [Chthoniobacterales bacterium]